MAIRERYRDQVRLLVRLLPLVADETCFALKGGTAINLFMRDLPRLSVDIDLVYLPADNRKNALAGIDAAMKRIEASILAKINGANVTRSVKEGAVLRLIVQVGRTQVKIEVSPVLRGVVFEPEMRDISPVVEDQFGFAEMQLVSFADLYAGKLVAALDRQHSRDLFDARDLLADEGITEPLREAFLVYLISHGRPMWEVLSGRHKKLSEAYANTFEGMTDEPVSIEELQAARWELVEMLVGRMPETHRKFLIGFEIGAPDWSLFGPKHIADLPAVKWRQLNLDKLDGTARARLVENLKKILNSTKTRTAIFWN